MENIVYLLSFLSLYLLFFISFFGTNQPTSTIRQTSQWGLAKGGKQKSPSKCGKYILHNSHGLLEMFIAKCEKNLYDVYVVLILGHNENHRICLKFCRRTFFRQEHWSAEPDVKVPHLHWIVTARRLPSIQILKTSKQYNGTQMFLQI